MALPIAPTPVLEGKETADFLKKMTLSSVPFPTKDKDLLPGPHAPAWGATQQE